jgi:hypothetical protein
MNRSAIILAGISLITILSCFESYGQTPMPEMLVKGTIRDQMRYINDKTNIYEGYRAIREDMFQMIKNNAVDSLDKSKNTILLFAGNAKVLNNRIDSLSNSLSSTKEALREMTSTKNAITILGVSLNKNVYNSIMFIVLAGLTALLVITYLAFKRTFVITRNTKKEINDLKEELEEYRKKTRLEREKISMDHFKEIQKMRKV